MTPTLQFDQVSFSYAGTPVLREVSLSLRSGEKLGLTGGMGAGKTTLLHLAVGLIRATGGTIRAFGRERHRETDFQEVRRRVGLLFQDSDDQLFCPTVLEDVAFGPLNLGFTVSAAKDRAAEALARVGMEGFDERVTYRLSGGEKRLIALATILAMEPDVLLLDEPQNGLDTDAHLRIRDLLVSLPQSMVVVSHDRSFLESIVTRTVELKDGVAREAGH